WRRSVHEVEHAIAGAQRQPHMCSRVQSISFAGNHPDHIAAAQLRLDFRHLALWNFIERSRGYIRFHARKRSEQRPIRSKITIMPPADAHLARGMGNAATA